MIRAPKPAALEALLDHGRVARAVGGCDIVFFDKQARAARNQPRTYAILAPDGTVITVGHRFRRLPR